MLDIKINKDYLTDIVKDKDIDDLNEMLMKAFTSLHLKTGHCQSGTGWLDNTLMFDERLLNRIKNVAKKIRQHQAFIIIGIGGSFLGSKAVIEALSHSFYNKTNELEIYFAGQNVDPTYLADLIEVIKDKDTVINVISKSGTTLETLLAFRVLKDVLFEKYGEKALERIIVTTDEKEGKLRKYAEDNQLESFIVPNDIGGRYSVLTPVGLLPIAASGIDSDLLIEGAKKLSKKYAKFNISHAYIQYGAIRYLLSQRNKVIEVLIYYQNNMRYFAEWYKQLFAESEGKDGKGIFPSSLMFSTDLHSFGQFLQQGANNFFETTINFNQVSKDIKLKNDKDDLGSLNYLSGYNYSDILKCVKQGTIEAHFKGGAPNIVIEVEKLNEYYLGQLIYFFEKACAISSLLNDVNPFDQPGVEDYKKNVKLRLEKLSKGRD
jgi:glucose-6-phosphate isomerase